MFVFVIPLPFFLSSHQNAICNRKFLLCMSKSQPDSERGISKFRPLILPSVHTPYRFRSSGSRILPVQIQIRCATEIVLRSECPIKSCIFKGDLAVTPLHFTMLNCLDPPPLAFLKAASSPIQNARCNKKFLDSVGQ